MSQSVFTAKQNDAQPSPRKRQRARKACIPCRQRKRKCDVQFPCSACSTYGYQCQYPTDDGPSAPFVDKSHASHVSSNSPTSAFGHSPNKAAKIERPQRDETPESPESAVDQGILDPVKARYMGLHSVMAFPRNLGLEFQSANPPRVHSFAWNCGIRPEENGSSHINLKDLISREESNGYLKVYFETVHPVFGILDQEIFSRTADQFWSEATGHSAFEAILAGVIALGSFFSATLGHPRELEIVQHAKSILEDPVISRRVSIDQVSAWVLRTLYLRSTTRPHMAWLASNIAMHLAEATGLHHETDAVVLTTTDPSSQFVPNESGREQARRLFWSAWMANSMISYEYGRSSTSLNNITCKQPSLIKGDYTSLLISLGQLIPRESLDGGPDLQHTLPKIQQIPDDHPFISTSKADLTMSLYRHHRLLKRPTEKREILQIISIGNVATQAAYQLAQENKFWWNVLCTVFQYVCVLLAIDTSESLAQVQNAMCTLENIAGQLQTHVSTEAVNTLKILLRDSMTKKKQQVQLLEAADSDLAANMGTEAGEMVNVDINWDALLDPWYVPTLLPQEFSIGAGPAAFYPTV
ncbi:Fungal specific transcription factor domain containing protein [Hyaloscypha variabilis]|uniref:Zn(2)-C6 fungal-type domain-containing protein n=1 Tax=Hyaloscypha variabilis (strain UAMH 11265 / GT02V1 / F) TaxID=1149755 RepID=A0A2J6RIW7_HYAVF|nr:hypothetical protein L207DRAFT_514362 [Hyaloscypha variabilis F]